MGPGRILIILPKVSFLWAKLISAHCCSLSFIFSWGAAEKSQPFPAQVPSCPSSAWRWELAPVHSWRFVLFKTTKKEDQGKNGGTISTTHLYIFVSLSRTLVRITGGIETIGLLSFTSRHMPNTSEYSIVLNVLKQYKRFTLVTFSVSARCSFNSCSMLNNDLKKCTYPYVRIPCCSCVRFSQATFWVSPRVSALATEPRACSLQLLEDMLKCSSLVIFWGCDVLWRCWWCP